jgi:hypothetical protein
MGPYCAVPGGSLTDVSSRYDNASPEATKPATPVAPATKLCGSTTLSGELSDTDLHLTRSVRLDARCVTSPYQYYQDVHAIELVGPGPHRLELEACEPTNISMALMIFQKVGSTSPYDTANTCLNLISSPQPAAHPNCTSNGVSARFVGMQPGTVFVVVSSEGPDKTGSYSLSLRSETSTCK